MDAEANNETGEAVRAVVGEVLERDSDARSWAAWAAAGLTALPVPEEHGGDGLGLTEVAVLLREAGRRAVQVPVWETLCCGALTLASYGTDAQRKELLPGIAAGELVVTPALRGSAVYDAGRVTGRKLAVTHAAAAHRLLVVATDGEREVVVLVDPRAEGVELQEASASSGAPQHTVVLDGAPAELL
ncbi:MAG TPA: acyl-CoA dehydrogenase family protein, partial [Nocardioides sp.]|nr:acyl-CoA dehydrogenase family protein [Nocardioides sp.]